MIGIGLALIGGISAFYDLSPQISLSPLQLLDTGDPFSAPFFVANEGYLPIEDVSAKCEIKLAHLEGATVKETKVYDSIDVARKILPGEKFTVKCRFREEIGMGSTKDADIAIAIAYQPFFIPIERHRKFRFVTARGSDGAWQWLPQPIN